MRIKFKLFVALVVGLGAGLLMAPTSVQAAVNYFDTTKTVYGTGSASCGAGWRVTGGGVETLPGDRYGTSTSDEYSLTGSYPSSSTAWRGTATRVHGTYTSSSGWRFGTYSYSPRVYAVCTS